MTARRVWPERHAGASHAKDGFRYDQDRIRFWSSQIPLQFSNMCIFDVYQFLHDPQRRCSGGLADHVFIVRGWNSQILQDSGRTAEDMLSHRIARPL